jgi:hypothetical protein
MVEVWSVKVTLLHVIDDERRLGGLRWSAS